MKDFNSEVQDMRGRTHKGLIKAAIILQRAAEPGTPVDTGNLRASWFTVSYKSGSQGGGSRFEGKDAAKLKSKHMKVLQQAQGLAQQVGSRKRPVVVFGYSANYAPFVHEMVGASFSRPTAHARWLYAAMKKSQNDMLEAIRQEAEF